MNDLFISSIIACSALVGSLYLALQAFAGLRREEARTLKTSNLSTDEKGNTKITLNGKGGKLAVVPVSTRLKGYINSALTELAAKGQEKSEFLLPNLAQLRKVREETLVRIVKKSGVNAEGEVHYHRFRHSFASNLIRAGKSIKAVQNLMRHSEIGITLNIYGHLLPSDLTEAVEI